MAMIRPFRALRPKPELASQLCELPYDVVSKSEARTAALRNPLSFFHVSRPEVDLPDSISEYAPEVYARGAANFRKLLLEGALIEEQTPCFYLYRQTLGAHAQTGLVAVASCEDYQQNRIKKHELTRADKELDRTRHVEVLNAQTGPAFLVYRRDDRLESIVSAVASQAPEIDFQAPDGVRHSTWKISQSDLIGQIQAIFESIPSLYIADGHHRTAAALRVSEMRQARGPSAFFLSVIFPHHPLQILPYNRVIKDLNGHSPSSILTRLQGLGEIQPVPPFTPLRQHEVAFHILDKSYRLRFGPNLLDRENPVERLDVALLQKHVLSPIFDIQDPRTNQRIQFIGGLKGHEEVQRRVIQGEFACGFALYPTTIEDLMTIADAGQIMPPKSTWFEPKLRDGLFTHLLE